MLQIWPNDLAAILKNKDRTTKQEKILAVSLVCKSCVTVFWGEVLAKRRKDIKISGEISEFP